MKSQTVPSQCILIVVDIYHYFEFIEPIQGEITCAIIRRCRENKEKLFLFILFFQIFIQKN